MAAVLVCGASGCVGFAVACAVRRSGRTVYGLIRKESQGDKLREQEIIPILGDAVRPDTYAAIIDEVETVIDCSQDYASPSANCDALIAALKASKSNGLKQYVYTSGILVHGHSDAPVTEATPCARHDIIGWRVALEKKLQATEGVSVSIIRPGFVYGKAMNQGAMLFGHSGDTVALKGRPDKRWSWVHLDDLGEAYVLLIAQPKRAMHGEIFDIAEPSPPTYEEVVRAGTALAGFRGSYVHAPADDFFSQFSNISVIIEPTKAWEVLAWRPKHSGVLSALPVYYRAWKASGGAAGH